MNLVKRVNLLQLVAIVMIGLLVTLTVIVCDLNKRVSRLEKRTTEIKYQACLQDRDMFFTWERLKHENINIRAFIEDEGGASNDYCRGAE